MEGRLQPVVEGYFGGMFPKMYERGAFSTAGQDSFTLAPSQNPDLFEALINFMPVSRGVLERRWGYGPFATLSGASSRVDSYRNDSGNFRKIVVGAASTGVLSAFNEDGSTYRASIYSTTPGFVQRVVSSRDYGFFYDGASADLKKWDGSSGNAVTNWGIVAPTAAPVVGVPTGGAITLASGRNYFLVFQNSTTITTSDLSPVSVSTGPLSAQNVPLTGLQVSGDSQVDTKFLLATLDGGDQTSLYLLATLANATTTYTDTTTDLDLSASNVYLETDQNGVEHGVSDNTPPPNCSLFVKHRGRIYGILNQYVYFSKSIDDVTTSTGTITSRYEEAWPATYFMEVTQGAETLKGLLSDGRSLYIGTERAIHRVTGDGPDNFDVPDVVFSQVGVLNQDVWQTTYFQGQPIGSTWLTPDGRVIGSDFNAYTDIGEPVQDILNRINFSVASSVASAAFFASPAFDLYILAIPTGTNTACDTLLVFDIRKRVWHVWNTSDVLRYVFFNVTQTGTPQLLFLPASKANLFLTSAASTTDNGALITSTAKTSWLDLGDSAAYKYLNEMEIMTADNNLLISVDGASMASQFITPHTVCTSNSITVGPRGTYKKFLAGLPTRDKWYRFTFASTGIASPILEWYRVEVLPVNRI